MNLKCINADTGLRLYNDGSAMLCCLSKEQLTNENGEIANIRKDTISSIMSGKKTIEIRDALNNGERHPNCSRCWEEEDAGLLSKRMRDNLDHADIIEETDLKLLEINLGTTCNLKCRICGPWSSSQWNKDYLNLGLWKDTEQNYKTWIYKFNHSYDDDSAIWEELKKNIHTIKQIDMYGGEPFMVKRQWEMLKYSIDQGYSKNQALHFNTNGTHFDEEKIEIMKQFKKVSISFSIDGIKKQFEYQRHPAKWSEVISNIEKFQTVANGLSNWNLTVCITVNNYNIFYLDTVLNFFRKQGILTYLNYLHDPPRWNIKNLRDDIKLLVVEKYKNTDLHQEDYQKIKGAIEFMNLKKSETNHWKSFLTLTTDLDNDRTESFKDVFPELYDLIYSIDHSWSNFNLKYLSVELSNDCNAFCPMCPRYIGRTKIVDPTLQINQITYKKFISYFSKSFLESIERITLSGTHGDPLMADDFESIIDYIIDCNKNIKIILYTNGSIRDQLFWKNLGSKLKNIDHSVHFNIPGLEDTSSRYMRGVDWNIVMKNCQAFIDVGGNAYWEFLVFLHNEKQIEEAREASKKIGFRGFMVRKSHGFNISGDQVMPTPVYDENCKFDTWIRPPSRDNVRDELILESRILLDDIKNYRSTINLKRLDKNYKGYLSREIECKSLETDTRKSEIYVNANGMVFPCSYVGTSFTGNYNNDADLQIRNIIEKSRDDLDLNKKSIAQILESKILDKLFSQKWSDKNFSKGKPVVCAFTCGKVK